MSLAAKALWIIERNSDQPIGLAELARACGVSRSHLAHAFGSATGVPAMKYLRGRRLSAAAKAHWPMARRISCRWRLMPATTLTTPIEIGSGTALPTLRPRFEQQGRMQVVGLSAMFSFEDTTGIPGQWQRFMARCAEIQRQSQDIPIGLGQAPDAEGQFRYLCGIEVSEFDDIPLGLEAAVVAPSHYAVFEHNGHVSTLYDTYAGIWNEALPEAGCAVADAAVIERHNAGFDPSTGEGGLTLWIPLSVRYAGQ